jgi:hypothetical protein
MAKSTSWHITHKSRYTLLQLSLTAVTNNPKHEYTTGIEHQDTSDESGAPTSSYPQGPLDPGEQASHSTPYYPVDLNEAARQLNQGQTTSTFIAPIRSEPFNLVPGRYSAPPLDSRDGYTSAGQELDPFLVAYPNLDLSIHCPQDGGPSQAQVDESVRLSCAAQALDAPRPAVHHHRVEAISTSDGGLDHELPTLEQWGQQNSGTSANVGHPAIVHDYLLHQCLGFGQSEVPQLYRSHDQPQVVAGPARPLLQHAPVLQAPFIYNDHGRVRSPSAPGHPSADLEGNVVGDDSAGAAQGNRATSQHFGALNYDDSSMTLQVPIVTPSPHCRRHQPGSQVSYETPQSTSDHYFRHR